MATRPIFPLIFDRSANDVQQKNAKGNWNVSDLNRIKEWQIYLYDLLNENGYHVEDLVIHDDWIKTDLPRQKDVNDIKENLQKLKDAYYVLQSTPSVPSTTLNYVTYNHANDIEKILFDMEYLVESMGTYFVHCGVANCGQNKVWQRRFRPRRTWNNIVFNTFGSLLDWITFENVSIVNESEVDGISKYNDVYATLVYQNNKYNEIDDLVGGIDVNN